MTWKTTTAVIGALALSAGAAGAQPKPTKPPAAKPTAAPRQVVTGPVAVYWMSAQTTSGFGAGMMGGGGAPGGGRGGRPSMGAMMGMAMGGGGEGGGFGATQHNLLLQLGSSRQAPQPQADHLPPQRLGAGSDLPLITPRGEPVRREESPVPREYQKPKGRMLIFWGCGDHARPNQPVVIDFAQMADGKVPEGLAAITRGLAITPMQPPSPGRNTTYGEWPNSQSRTTVPGNGSLTGAHTVQGNYTPEIRFNLGPSQDFLAPLQFTTNALGPLGQALLAWNPVNRAEGYLASVIGGGEEGRRGRGGDDATVVIWTSSEIPASAFALPDYLSPGDIARLVAAKALMTPQTTSCAVPREVVQAAPNALVQLAAYGGETNLSFPPRPEDPRTPWNIDWTVKVRYKSQTGGLLGQAMPGMGGDMSQDDGEGRGPPPPQGKRPGFGGSILKGVLSGKIPGQ